MCGIIGYFGERETGEVLYDGLKRLDYRGYDSWGVATEKGRTKNTGQIDEKLVKWSNSVKNTKTGIGHTRWATHGGVTKENAHPHESCKETLESIERKGDFQVGQKTRKRFAIVHNGIIENYEELVETIDERSNKSHEYTSETDSEVIAHWLEHETKNGRTVCEALNVFHEEAEGSYAIVVLDREEEQLYGLKNKSPLVFATEKRDEVPPGLKGAFFASDIYAISKYVDEAYFMEDGDIIMTSGSNLTLFREGDVVEEGIDYEEFEWTEEDPELGNQDHWMEKEIEEIPEALERLEYENCPEPSQKIENIAKKIENSERVIFTASGTSYHASLLGVYYLQKAGVEAQALIASEFKNYERVDENTTLIAVSQSGETRDVLDAIEYSKKKGADIVSITNVPYSSIERESSLNYRINARQEICVAATKTFTNQLGTMMLLARELGADVQLEGIAHALKSAYDTKTKAIEDAALLNNEQDIYVLGSGITYPISREIALKLKEISYKHAEGMMAGELKHGTLALIEEGTPVIALNEGGLDSSISEVESRGANVINIEWKKRKNPESEELYLFRAVIYGFWLTYYLGKINKLPIDKPRNLAKSVTVK